MKNLFNKVFSKKTKRTASAIASKAISETCGGVHLAAQLTMKGAENLEANLVHRLTGEMKDDIILNRVETTLEREKQIYSAAQDLLAKAKSFKKSNKREMLLIAEVSTINPDLTRS